MNSEAELSADQALREIDYMRQLLQGTRLHVANTYPIFLMWGTIWVVGYLGTLLLPANGSGFLWLGLILIGVVGGIVIGARKPLEPTPTLLSQRLGWLNILSFIMLGILPSVVGFRSESAMSAYFPFFIGFIYLLNGLFLGREMLTIGGWLMVAGFASLFMPVSAQLVWLAVAGGGSLILTGVLLRRQLRG